MKKVGLALASAFLILVGSGVKAQEMPFGFGIKAGYLNPTLTELKDATKPFAGGAVKEDLVNPSFNAGLFGEYAFHDYIGAGIEAYYAMTGARFHKDGGVDDKMVIRIQQINAIPMLKIYPMGRNIDETIFNIHLGPELCMPLKATYKHNEKEETNLDKKELNSFNVAGFGGLGVEFPFGLLLEARGSYGFMGAFTKDSKFKTDTLGLKEDKNNNPWYANVVLGYNFARLLEE